MLINTLVECLLEAKVDDILNHPNYDSISNTDKESYLSKIPNKNTNHLRWILNQHLTGKVNQNSDINKTLTTFDRSKDMLDKKQLSQYKTFDDLHKAITPYIESTATKKENAVKGSTVVYHTPTMTVTRHDTHEAAIEAAKIPKSNPMYDKTSQKGKAQWCVSIDGNDGLVHFNHYTSNNETPFYTIDTGNRRFGVIDDKKANLSNIELRDEKDEYPYMDSNENMTDKNNSVIKFGKKHPEIFKTPLHGVFGGEYSAVKNELTDKIINNEHIEPKLLKRVLDTKSTDIIKLLAKSKENHLPEVFNHMANTSVDKDSYIDEILRSSFNAGNNHEIPKHIKEHIENNWNHNRQILTNNQSYNNQKILNELSHSSDPEELLSAINNKNCPNRKEKLDDFVNNKYPHIRQNLNLTNIFNNEHLTGAHIEKMYEAHGNQDLLKLKNTPYHLIKSAYLNKKIPINEHVLSLDSDKLRDLYNSGNEHNLNVDSIAFHKKAPSDLVNHYVHQHINVSNMPYRFTRLMNKVANRHTQIDHYIKNPELLANHLSNFEKGNNDMEVGDNYVYPSTVKGVADKLAKYKDDIPSNIKYAQEVLKHPLAKLDMNMLEAHHQQQMSKRYGDNI